MRTVMERSRENVLQKAKNADVVIIVGAGKRGQELFDYFENGNSVSVQAFFDNDEKLIGNYINGVMVEKPHNVSAINCVYIIAVDKTKYRKQFRAQLLALGINSETVVIYSHYRDYEYLSTLDERFYKEELSAMYYEHFGKEINWENPRTYNEKINWEKLNVNDERRTKLADKYLVRGWIAEKIGEKYLTRLYGVWNMPEDIDFNVLPTSFVLKLNNGSVRNVVVKDKSNINYDEVRKQLNEWKSWNFAYQSLELHYRDIPPKIICEEYLDGVADSVYEYDIFCFHGEPVYIWCIKGSHKPECQASFYNINWEMQPFGYGYPKDPIPAPKPEKLEEMLALSKILCQEFQHVRIDWYNLPDGRVLFGEMTFSTWAGFMKWEPEEYDAFFGELI